MNIKPRHILFAFLIMQLSSGSLAASGNIAIVTGHNQSLSVSSDGLRGLFLGRSLITDDGEQLQPVFLDQNNVHDAFLKRFLRRTASQLNSYWAIRIFTGKSSPPVTVNGSEEMLRFLAENKNYIGYINAENIDSNVRVLQMLSVK